MQHVDALSRAPVVLHHCHEKELEEIQNLDQDIPVVKTWLLNKDSKDNLVALYNIFSSLVVRKMCYVEDGLM